MSTVTGKKQFTLVFVLDEPNQKVIIVVRIYFLVIQCLARTPSFLTLLCASIDPSWYEEERVRAWEI